MKDTSGGLYIPIAAKRWVHEDATLYKRFLRAAHMCFVFCRAQTCRREVISGEVFAPLKEHGIGPLFVQNKLPCGRCNVNQLRDFGGRRFGGSQLANYIVLSPCVFIL